MACGTVHVWTSAGSYRPTPLALCDCGMTTYGGDPVAQAEARGRDAVLRDLTNHVECQDSGHDTKDEYWRGHHRAMVDLRQFIKERALALKETP